MRLHIINALCHATLQDAEGTNNSLQKLRDVMMPEIAVQREKFVKEKAPILAAVGEEPIRFFPVKPERSDPVADLLRKRRANRGIAIKEKKT